MLLELIKRAIAYISGQKAAVTELQRQVAERDEIIHSLRNQATLDVTTLREAAEKSQRDAEAAKARAEEYAATLAELETAGNDLGAAINLHPDTPIVSPSFEVIAESGVPENATPEPETPSLPVTEEGAESETAVEPEAPAPDSVGEEEEAE
jgi:hypothetical protein